MHCCWRLIQYLCVIDKKINSTFFLVWSISGVLLYFQTNIFNERNLSDCLCLSKPQQIGGIFTSTLSKICTHFSLFWQIKNTRTTFEKQWECTNESVWYTFSHKIAGREFMKSTRTLFFTKKILFFGSSVPVGNRNRGICETMQQFFALGQKRGKINWKRLLPTCDINFAFGKYNIKGFWSVELLVFISVWRLVRGQRLKN